MTLVLIVYCACFLSTLIGFVIGTCAANRKWMAWLEEQDLNRERNELG